MAITNIKIYIPVEKTATTATMYFPLNMADQRGIFKSVIGENISIMIEGQKGDSEAIKALYPKQDDAKQDNNNTLSLAIADPTALVKLYKNRYTTDGGVKKIKVIGALINRLSFWAISKKKDEKDNKDEECSLTDYTTIITYTEEYRTSYMIGEEFMWECFRLL